MYYNSLIIIMFAAFFVDALSPSVLISRKFIRPICGVVLLFVLVSPIYSFGSNEKINEFSLDNVVSENIGDKEVYTVEAYTIFEYLSAEYNIDSADVTFITDDMDELVEIQLFSDNIPLGLKDEIKNELYSRYGCEVRIYSEE